MSSDSTRSSGIDDALSEMRELLSRPRLPIAERHVEGKNCRHCGGPVTLEDIYNPSPVLRCAECRASDWGSQK
jgi:hypothetical protein